MYKKKIEVDDGFVWIYVYAPNGKRTYFNYLTIGPLSWRLKRAHKLADKHIKTLMEHM